MPTIVLLDTSLSMTRPVSTSDNTEEYQRRHLAIRGISAFLDHLTVNAKLEFVSLVTFSAHTEQLVPFTRDYETIKAAIFAADDHNKTCIETALRSLSTLAREEWGINAACQAILVTDGSTGTGETSLARSLQAYHQSRSDAQENKFALPFDFPCKLIIMCVAPPGDSALQTALPLYEELIEINGRGGEVFCPEGALSLKSSQQMFVAMAERYFRPYFGTLKCGHLESRVQMLPSPDIYDRAHDFEHVYKTVSDVIQVIGFLHIGDIASPPYISRHLCLPVSTSNTDGDAKAGKVKGDSGKEDEEDAGDGKTAAFTVLLHGSLKVESMAALVLLAEEWFGILYSWADSKKKSNLMLSVFTPGADVIPWLGNLNNLAPVTDFSESPYGEDNNKTPFPVKPPDRRSYAQNCVVWIKPAGLQTDIQKILRNARKLPEKQQNFYKELNRLRRAVLSYGFHELLDAVAQLLERECTLLPGNAHPDAALQLSHAATALRADSVWDIGQNILPLRTNFTGE